MRVILDTNILLGGMISPGRLSAQIIEAWLDRRFTLVSHALQLDEIREVSRRDKIRERVRPAVIGRLVNQIALIADMPASLPPVERSRDSYDDFLLALCEASSADWLITGDKNDLLALHHHGSTQIATASAFGQHLGIGRA